MNILRLRELRILYNEDAVLTILKIKLWSTLLNVSHAEEIRFRETNSMMK